MTKRLVTHGLWLIAAAAIIWILALAAPTPKDGPDALTRTQIPGSDGWASLAVTAENEDRSQTFDVRVRYLGITYHDQLPQKTDLPDTTQLVALRFEFSADPAAPISHCIIAGQDEQGRWYSTQFSAPYIGLSWSPCTGDIPSPRYLGDEPLVPRPDTWTQGVGLFLPAGARLERVVIWWHEPDGMEFTL